MDGVLICLERVVDALDEERAQRRVGHDVRSGEPGGGEDEHAEHEPRTQRQALKHYCVPASSM
jgi:hypothetical protein